MSKTDILRTPYSLHLTAKVEHVVWRVDILDRVYRWMDIKDSQLQDVVVPEEFSGSITVTEATAENSRIFWINGSAGTGKTTIASTIAKACRIRGTLGASFFCSRDDVECSNPNLIFTTIAYQLGQFVLHLMMKLLGL